MLSSSQRRFLQVSVQLNPLLVANADAKFTLAEGAALQASMRRLLSEEAYRPVLLLAGQQELPDAALRVALDTHRHDLDGYLRQVAQLLEQVPPDLASAYRRFTLHAILEVAEASRGGLLGLVGARICELERRTIHQMIDLLKLEPTSEMLRKLENA